MCITQFMLTAMRWATPCSWDAAQVGFQLPALYAAISSILPGIFATTVADGSKAICLKKSRLLVNDRPGVLAAIASTLAAQQMSIASVIQKNVLENGLAELIIITYKVSRLSLELSMRTLQVLPVVKKVCSVLRVEDPNL